MSAGLTLSLKLFLSSLYTALEFFYILLSFGNKGLFIIQFGRKKLVIFLFVCNGTLNFPTI